ncbi:asparagine synthase (glutamine-hydrolysing) [Actinorugispora endophytica]|uniref:Asparagine synthase (Glutamine-hydrolysing) n=1 Tax=Actinorugispora endophytica TaxID=1605990 RepID=A0A4R6V3T0_9ACTN|nr:asparagine synthase (glutamine-hydrolysing) [Actinorugispora endophytica]
MWCFGGFSGESSALRPKDSRLLWSDTPNIWVSGQTSDSDVRCTRHGDRRIAVFGPNSVPDGELIRLGVEGVPDDAAWKWPGSYVVIEISSTGTSIWTDLCSAQPVYTLPVDRGTLWASSSRLLASLNGMHLDLDHLIHRLVASGSSLQAADRSYFADVSLVPAAHRFSLDTAGRSTTRPLWHPRFHTENHARRLRGALEEAVALRVDKAKVPSTDFSGGFDSTGLGLLAAERLHPERVIIGVTVHPAGVVEGGDIDYAREAASHPGIRHEWMALGCQHSPYQGISSVTPSDEPAPSTVAYAALSAQFQWMRDRFGCDHHMTGDGGDSLLTTPVTIVNDLLGSGRLPRAVAEVFRWARLRQTSAWQAWRSARGNREAPDTPGWLTGDALERLNSLPDGVPDRFGGDSTALKAVLNSMSEIGRSARSESQLAEPFGIQLHNPYTDSAVVNSYLSIHPKRLPSPSHYKPVMAEAMRDLFPDRLLRRTTKGDASSDHYRGIRNALPEIHELMDGALSDLGLVKPDSLRHSVSRAAAGTTTHLSSIKNAVSTEIWVRALRAAPPVAWIASEKEIR